MLFYANLSFNERVTIQINPTYLAFPRAVLR